MTNARIPWNEPTRTTWTGAIGTTPGWYSKTTLRRVDKWQALSRYCSRRGMPPTAVGDASNDLPMIRAAALGVAMANASQHVRNAADWIAPTNNDDGVAALIDRLLAAR